MYNEAHELLQNTEQVGGCLIWKGPYSGATYTGKATRPGYGQFKEGRKNVFAHRRMYEIVCGEIPAGMFVMHTCDNPRCINPNHLRVGTHAENMRDMAEKRRATSGASHPQAKLSAGQIKTIIRMSGEGVPRATLMRRFGISKSTLYRILWGKSYKDEVSTACTKPQTVF